MSTSFSVNCFLFPTKILPIFCLKKQGFSPAFCCFSKVFPVNEKGWFFYGEKTSVFFVFHKLFSRVIPKKSLFFIGKCDKI